MEREHAPLAVQPPRSACLSCSAPPDSWTPERLMATPSDRLCDSCCSNKLHYHAQQDACNAQYPQETTRETYDRHQAQKAAAAEYQRYQRLRAQRAQDAVAAAAAAANPQDRTADITDNVSSDTNGTEHIPSPATATPRQCNLCQRSTPPSNRGSGGGRPVQHNGHMRLLYSDRNRPSGQRHSPELLLLQRVFLQDHEDDLCDYCRRLGQTQAPSTTHDRPDDGDGGDGNGGFWPDSSSEPRTPPTAAAAGHHPTPPPGNNFPDPSRQHRQHPTAKHYQQT